MNKPFQETESETLQTVLLVDDIPENLRLLSAILTQNGYVVRSARSGPDALEYLEREIPAVILLDIKMPEMDGFEVCRCIKANKKTCQIPVIFISALNEVEDKVRAFNAGGVDYVTKPFQEVEVLARVNTHMSITRIQKQLEESYHAIETKVKERTAELEKLKDRLEKENVYFQEEIKTTHNFGEIIGQNKRFKKVLKLIEQVAPSETTVLILGETGTGKELIARAIHDLSDRKNRPMVKVNCAALPSNLIESELFGHEKGAFTGAYFQRKGRFEMAHGGTLLLDEITETPIKFQAKLLRVLEQQDFERVGGNDNIKVNVRVISTTNKDLLQEVTQGRFRQDLYYRLSSLRLVIPPLRKRNEDLLGLVWHFVNLNAREAQRHITRLDPVMMDIFANYPWPGNVRQLRNVVLTSLILGTGQTLSLADVSWLFDELQPLAQQQGSNIKKHQRTAESNTDAVSDLAGLPLEHVERLAILDTLRHTAGNQTKAAKVLGISDRTLRGKIRRYRQQKCVQLT